jgi:hypothetical protein
MKQETAVKTLIKQVNFLGFKNLGELVADIEQNPLAYPLGVMTAYRVYKEEALR